MTPIFFVLTFRRVKKTYYICSRFAEVRAYYSDIEVLKRWTVELRNSSAEDYRCENSSVAGKQTRRCSTNWDTLAKDYNCENSSVGRARPCQGRGRGFESRFSLSHRSHSCPDGGMVDTKDLKSFGLTAVRVQVPLRVPRSKSSNWYSIS